jgi:hypothetical protein
MPFCHKKIKNVAVLLWHDLSNKKGKEERKAYFFFIVRDSEHYLYDVITANGGFVGVIKDASGNEYMIDTWDLQPFKDDFRSFWPWGTKHLPFIKYLEILEVLRSDPFTVVHKLKQPNYEVYN